MDVYTTAEVAGLWRIPGYKDTLVEDLVNGEIEAAFRYEGRAIAEDREKGTQTEVEISGVFYFDSLVPGIHIGDSPHQIPEWIEVASFCATPDSRFAETMKANVDMDSFCPGGSMVFKPLGPNPVHIDDLLITDDELKRIAQELGLPHDAPSGSSGVDTRERATLLKLVGVLVNIVVGVPPADKFTKGDDKVLNVEKVTNEILDFVEGHLDDKAGMSRRNIHKKVTEALKLLDDLKSGLVRN